EMCFRDLQHTARAVHGAAVRLEVALASAAELAGSDVARAAAAQTEGLRRNLRDLLAPYLERTRRPGRHDSPGSYPRLRARFAPLAEAPLASDAELLATSARFLSLAATCLDDAALLASASAD
ncbi:MAG TPA: hypothetical protein VHE35_13175, partial [Kofleriaceae bacterium]|nr:hypothetical protein [Kofleriaceae bacterium]